MTCDLAVVGGLSLSLGLWVTLQVFILIGLFSRHQRWPAWLGLLVPVAAPVLAYRAGFHIRAVLWVLAAVTYLVIRLSFQG